jgi:hypothetical protein
VDIHIYCFYEERAVVGVGVVVPEQEAVLPMYASHVIAENHMSMTRFSAGNDDGYQKVLGVVLVVVELIEETPGNGL